MDYCGILARDLECGYNEDLDGSAHYVPCTMGNNVNLAVIDLLFGYDFAAFMPPQTVCSLQALMPGNSPLYFIPQKAV